MDELVKFTYEQFHAAQDLRGNPADRAPGSKNQVPVGERQFRPIRGMAPISEAGAQLLFPIKDTWGGLDWVGGQDASGSLFSSLADSLFFVGNGQVVLEGAYIAGAIATSLLKVLLKWNGSYTNPNSGPFQVGLPEPSKLQVGILDTPVAGGTPSTNGLYSFKVARLRGPTGGKSRASATSDVLNLVGKAAYVVIPEASDGQTVHPIFVTEKGLGGVGLHLRLSRANPFTGTEYTENDVEREISTLSVTNGSPVVTDSASGFTAQDDAKLFEAVSSGWSVPAGTVVLSVDANNQITLSNNVTVSSGANPRTGRLTSYVNNIERAVSLNWTESDLAAEAAEIDWIYDFPPPPASHAFQLENRIGVASYADSTATTSSTNPGTALVFSLSNQLESFDIRFPLYLPEAVVHILSRGVDSYRFLGCRNGIYAVQYINADIPATLSIILPNEGIANPNNWCLGRRGLYVCTARGKLIRIGEGAAVDETFYEPIRNAIADWPQDEITLVAEPRLGGLLVMRGTKAYLLDEQTGKWSDPLYLNELGLLVGYEVASGLGIEGRTILAFQDILTGLETLGDSSRLEYEFDHPDGSGARIVSMSPFVASEGGVAAIQEIASRFIVTNASENVYVGIHRDGKTTYVDDAITALGDATVASSSLSLTSDDLGAFVLIQLSGNWLLGRIRLINSATSFELGTPTDDFSASVALNVPETNPDGVYMLIAHRVFTIDPSRTGGMQVSSGEISLTGLRTVAASIAMVGSGTGPKAQALAVTLNGYIDGEQWADAGGVWT